MILINSNTRQFNVPGADLVFGVSGDSDTERKHFQCPRYVGNNLDLMSCFVRINFRNGNGKMDSYLVDDMTIDGDNVTFSWLLSPKVTEYRGQVRFVLCAVGPDLKLKWHTTQGTGQVMEGQEPDNSHAENQTADVVAQLIAMVEEQTSAVERVGTEQIAMVKSAAETARTDAVNEIEAKTANSLASIPNDYTTLSSTVESLAREKAPGIVCSAEGEVITLNDASDDQLRGLRIFGKSTQNGVPAPENPVEIVSVENPTISVDEQTLSVVGALHGIPVTSGGNYTDENGQQWICDEVDFERGVYVQRAVLVDDFVLSLEKTGTNVYACSNLPMLIGQSINAALCTITSEYSYVSSDYIHFYVHNNVIWVYAPKGFDNSNKVVKALVALQVPVEKPLSAEELAAYRALHTNKPNTTILNDSGAYMSVEYTADTKLYIDNKIKEALQC